MKTKRKITCLLPNDGNYYYIVQEKKNGAIGIMRKGNAITDAQLLGLRDRGDVVSPKVFKLNL